MKHNSDQADLFDAYTRARPSDPDTSHAIAERIQYRLTGLRIKVLAYFRSIYPQSITDLDLQAYFDNHGSTYRTRRAELTEMGLIRDTGLRRWQADAHRVLWVATPWRTDA